MEFNNQNIRLIASYLPQFHPIPENDLWWGKGFTEWTNVGKAKPLFKGHYQPRVPADLGYYDLRITDVQKAQAELAREYGIEGFCYWHYWFGNGKRLLEMPFNSVLKSGEPNFPFCLGWANESWKGFAHGLKNRNTLIEQLYPGADDYTAHFYNLLEAFNDKRYIRVNNKPVFLIYKPLEFTDVEQFVDLWQKLAIQNGLNGIYFIGQTTEIFKKNDILKKGFDAVNIVRLYDYTRDKRNLAIKVYDRVKRSMGRASLIYEYSRIFKTFVGEEERENNIIPTIIPNWDHSPRSGIEGYIIHNSTPELFEKHVKQVVKTIEHKPSEERIAFIKSWNEWGEGNYLEPDLRFGLKYLEALKRGLN